MSVAEPKEDMSNLVAVVGPMKMKIFGTRIAMKLYDAHTQGKSCRDLMNRGILDRVTKTERMPVELQSAFGRRFELRCC